MLACLVGWLTGWMVVWLDSQGEGTRGFDTSLGLDCFGFEAGRGLNWWFAFVHTRCCCRCRCRFFCCCLPAACLSCLPLSASLFSSVCLSFWLPGPVYPFDWHYFIINFRWQHLTHMQHRSNVRASLESLTTSKNTITYWKRDNDVSSATEIKFAPLTFSYSFSFVLSW